MECKFEDPMSTSGIGKYCQANWDSFAKAQNTCPVLCDNTQKYCSVPAYSSTGDWVKTVDYCEAKDKDCDCTKGQNSKKCEFTAGDMKWSECIAVTAHCPKTCPADKPVQCPEVDNFNKDGEWTSSSAPADSLACAAKIDSCPCGQGAKKCTDASGSAWCQPTKDDCPKSCEATEKKCLVTNFDAEGKASSGNEQCVAMDAECPCGTGTSKCEVDGQSMCMPTAMAKELCPCKAGEDVCYVEDYNTKGQSEEFRPVCVKKGQTCPCGKNTKTCTDEQDATAKVCIAKFGAGKKSCPTPCTPTAEAGGNSTCIQTHLDKDGAPEAKDVSCLPEGKCQPGRGQKTCPSTGATIGSAFSCKNIYGQESQAGKKKAGAGRLLSQVKRRLAAVASGSKQTVSVSFTLINLAGDKTTRGKKLPGVKVKLDSLLMKQPSIETVLSKIETKTSAAMMYKIRNLGATKVSPSKMGDTFKRMVDAKDKDLINALEDIGKVQYGKSGCCTISADLSYVINKAEPKSKALEKAKKEKTKTTASRTTPKPSSALINAAQMEAGISRVAAFGVISSLVSFFLL